MGTSVDTNGDAAGKCFCPQSNPQRTRLSADRNRRRTHFGNGHPRTPLLSPNRRLGRDLHVFTVRQFTNMVGYHRLRPGEVHPWSPLAGSGRVTLLLQHFDKTPRVNSHSDWSSHGLSVLYAVANRLAVAGDERLR